MQNHCQFIMIIVLLIFISWGQGLWFGFWIQSSIIVFFTLIISVFLYWFDTIRIHFFLWFWFWIRILLVFIFIFVVFCFIFNSKIIAHYSLMLLYCYPVIIVFFLIIICFSLSHYIFSIIIFSLTYLMLIEHNITIVIIYDSWIRSSFLIVRRVFSRIFTLFSLFIVLVYAVRLIVFLIIFTFIIMLLFSLFNIIWV